MYMIDSLTCHFVTSSPQGEEFSRYKKLPYDPFSIGEKVPEGRMRGYSYSAIQRVSGGTPDTTYDCEVQEPSGREA